MCWQVAPLIASAIGAKVQHDAQNDQQQRQDRAAAEGILRQNALSRQADTKVAQNVQSLATSNPEGDIAKRRAAYTDALRRAAPARAGAMPTSGNVSSRFAGEIADDQNANDDIGAQLADTTARIDAPGYQRLREGVAADNTVVDLNLLRGRSQGQDYLTRLKIAMQRQNPWAQAGGQVLSGLGSGLATNGGWDADAPSGVWDDGSRVSGLTAAQRRAKQAGG